MRDPRSASRELLGVSIAALLLVAAVDLMTNSIDTERFSWDFRYYIDMAEHGFGTSLASPFAYRYLTPLLARVISILLKVPTAAGFSILAYVGAFSQLLAVFLFARWYTRSTRGAWFAMLIAAFSFYNVKFLLFDTFRPDHLAYPLILLQAYFALSGRFTPLLVTTLVGCQIREFNAVPLVAYLYASTGSLEAGALAKEPRKTITQFAISIIGLGIAIALPRMLIQVSDDFQFASFTQVGMLRALLSPLILTRDANFIYSVIAYILPVLILGSVSDFRAAFAGIAPRDRRFWGAYTVLVLILSFLGGTDFPRFAAYLVAPQAVMLGILGDRRPAANLGLVAAAVFVFNRLWLPLPMSDVNAYLDFYGGHGVRVNAAFLFRVAECVVLIAAGAAARRLLATPKSQPPLAPA